MPRPCAHPAGARNRDIYAALPAHGVVIPYGRCPTVGVGGFLLGGGFGFNSRKIGAASDNLLSTEVVTADGEVRTASATSEPDLFWACRGGGGGNFGIHTELHHAQSSRTHLLGLFDHLEGIGRGHRLRGRAACRRPRPRRFLVPDRCRPGRPSAARTTHGPGARPVLGPAVGTRRPPGPGDQGGAAAQAHHPAGVLHRRAEVSRGRSPGRQLHREVGLSARAATTADRRVRLDGDPASASLAGQLEQHRGRAGDVRLGRRSESGKASRHGVRPPRRLVAVRGWRLLEPKGHAPKGGVEPALARRSQHALGRYSNGQAYQNFIDPALGDWQRAYYGPNIKRLVAAKRKYDPDALFRFAQGIPLAPRT